LNLRLRAHPYAAPAISQTTVNFPLHVLLLLLEQPAA
jgi:hypothetical protein